MASKCSWSWWWVSARPAVERALPTEHRGSCTHLLERKGCLAGQPALGWAHCSAEQGSGVRAGECKGDGEERAVVPAGENPKERNPDSDRERDRPRTLGRDSAKEKGDKQE